MLGSSVALKCLERGAKVTILDAMFPLYGANEKNLSSKKKDVEVLITDIRDEAAINYALKEKDIVFNFAGQVSYLDSMSDPFSDLDINCRGHLVLLEAARKLKKRPVIIFSSSRMVYGKIFQNPVAEDYPTNPLMIYGVHKLVGEKYHYMFYRDYGVPCVICRIANPYGPRQQMKHSKYGIINWFTRLCMTGEKIKIFGDGEQLRDYIYIDDIAEAVIAASVSNRCIGNTYNVGSGTGTSFRKMAETVVDVVGKGDIEFVPWPKNYQNIETGDYISDISAIQKDTGFCPHVDLKVGIKKTFEYYKKYKKYYWTD
jgi:nucleoside-diphosphate-sugar epimerase